jgi:hexokinase
MAAAYERGDCLCGGIFGTGTNGAYVESIDKLTKMGYKSEELEKNKAAGLDTMVVNTEWGAFDNEVRFLSLVDFPKQRR